LRLEGELTQLRTKVGGLNKREGAARKKVDSVQAELVSLKRKLADVTCQKTGLETRTAAEIAKLKQQLKKATDELDRAKAKHGVDGTTISNLQQKLNDAQSQLTKADKHNVCGCGKSFDLHLCSSCDLEVGESKTVMFTEWLKRFNTQILNHKEKHVKHVTLGYPATRSSTNDLVRVVAWEGKTPNGGKRKISNPAMFKKEFDNKVPTNGVWWVSPIHTAGAEQKSVRLNVNAKNRTLRNDGTRLSFLGWKGSKKNPRATAYAKGGDTLARKTKVVMSENITEKIASFKKHKKRGELSKRIGDQESRESTQESPGRFFHGTEKEFLGAVLKKITA